MTRCQLAPKGRIAVVKDISRGMFIDGQLDGMPRKFLVDTGATKTIVNKELGRRMKSTSWKLKTATGEQVSVYGEMDAQFTIGSTSFKHPVLVADIEEDVILGTDLMVKYGFALNLGEGTLKVRGEEVILHSRETNPAQVYLMEDIVLPGRSEVVLQARSDHQEPESCIALMEPCYEYDNNRKGILIAKAVIQVKRNIPVRVMNLNDYDVHLKEGTTIGFCVPISSVVCQMPQTPQNYGILPHSLESLIETSSRELSKHQQYEVRKLISKYQDVFDIDEAKGRTNIVRHKIDTGDAKPIRQAARRLPLAKREEAEQIIKEMERDGVIEPSNSPWASPVVLVKKKDGSTRFCVDYRRLNDVTRKDSYPLPRIDDTLDTLAESKIFSTLDLKSGYWQVGLDPADREKTAFTIGTGLYQFTVMPFGLCNAPATFERLMETVLKGLSWKTCLVYLDDIIVVGKNVEDHMRNLEEVFKRMREANLKFSPKKCNLFRKEVSFLGHIISGKGVAVDPEKTRAVSEWPVPKDQHELRSFLGLCTYYRRYVLGFANIAKPLTRLTEKDQKFVWDESCMNAFEQLKEALVSAPILAYPLAEGKFILDTDASNFGIGGVLSQIQQGQEKVIGYFSKTLSKPERNYCVTRKELLAVVKSAEHFYKYLYGRKFLLRTDHAALQWLLRFKNPEGQMARWIERLQEYNFDTEHRAGGQHRNADALSRRPCIPECKHCSRAEEKTANLCRTTATAPEWSDEELIADQEADPELGLIKRWKAADEKPVWQEVSRFSPSIKSYWAQWESIVIEDGVLKRAVESEDGKDRRLQLLVPKKRVPEVLRQLHSEVSGGHLGVNRTMERLRQRFYWVKCKEDVKDWCRKCEVCASSNGPQPRRKAPMRQYNVGSPFERIAIDIAGPFPTSDQGNKYILVAMDYFTKWAEAYALPNQEATTVADVLIKEFISRFGVPRELHSDQGRNFESEIFQRMCEVLGIHKTRTTALHPQSDGMVERMNRTMGKYLSKVVSDHQRDWDQYIPLFLLAYRSSVHASTNESPANVLFGRELRLPCDLQFGIKPGEDVAGEDYVSKLRAKMEDIHERVRSNIQSASDRMKENYDVKADDRQYQEGDFVWLYNPQRRRGLSPKLQRSWEGPYSIMKKINSVVYRIKKCPNGKPRVVHFNRLAPYSRPDDEEEPATCNTFRGCSEYEDFMALVKDGRKVRNNITQEVEQDLFSAPEEYALAHCVAEDLRMSKGIAMVFRKKFGGIEELRRQKPEVGKALSLNENGRKIYYLVTKQRSQDKPTYKDLWTTLKTLKRTCLEENVRQLAIPKIGCGLDGLDWRLVRSMVEHLFHKTGIDVLVCSYNHKDVSPTWKTVECYFFKNGRCTRGWNCRFLHEWSPDVFRDGTVSKRGAMWRNTSRIAPVHTPSRDCRNQPSATVAESSRNQPLRKESSRTVSKLRECSSLV